METLQKMEGELMRLGHTGDVALGFMIEKETGIPRPTEWTCREGWPFFNLAIGAVKGDPAKWMLDALDGEDTTTFSQDIGICLVVTTPPFPFADGELDEVTGNPIYGITNGNKRHLHPQGVKIDTLPDMDGDKVVQRPLWNTAGAYNLVVTGYGSTVKQSAERAYKTVKQLSISNMMVRDDVGEKLKESLPELQKHGYATHCKYQ
jgi:phosphoribosylamine-glycine ligase